MNCMSGWRSTSLNDLLQHLKLSTPWEEGLRSIHGQVRKDQTSLRHKQTSGTSAHIVNGPCLPHEHLGNDTATTPNVDSLKHNSVPWLLQADGATFLVPKANLKDIERKGNAKDCPRQEDTLPFCLAVVLGAKK